MSTTPANLTREELLKLCGADLIKTERLRQIHKEGWTPDHDAGYKDGQLILAAIVYASEAHGDVGPRLASDVEKLWPWEAHWFKPTTPERALVKAGALIAAEIDRRRAEAADPTPEKSVSPTEQASGEKWAKELFAFHNGGVVEFKAWRLDGSWGEWEILHNGALFETCGSGYEFRVKTSPPNATEEPRSAGEVQAFNETYERFKNVHPTTWNSGTKGTGEFFWQAAIAFAQRGAGAPSVEECLHIFEKGSYPFDDAPEVMRVLDGVKALREHLLASLAPVEGKAGQIIKGSELKPFPQNEGHNLVCLPDGWVIIDPSENEMKLRNIYVQHIRTKYPTPDHMLAVTQAPNPKETPQGWLDAKSSDEVVSLTSDDLEMARQGDLIADHFEKQGHDEWQLGKIASRKLVWKLEGKLKDALEAKDREEKENEKLRESLYTACERIVNRDKERDSLKAEVERLKSGTASMQHAACLALATDATKEQIMPSLEWSAAMKAVWELRLKLQALRQELERRGGWVSVKERMPTREDADKYGNVTWKWDTSMPGVLCEKAGFPINQSFNSLGVEPIAWRHTSLFVPPLPPAPESVEEDVRMVMSRYDHEAVARRVVELEKAFGKIMATQVSKEQDRIIKDVFPLPHQQAARKEKA